MKLGPLLLVSLLLHGALLLALIAAPDTLSPAPPPTPSLVWMHLAAPAPEPAAAAAPAAAPAALATAPTATAAPPGSAAPLAPQPAATAASRSSRPPATTRGALPAPVPAAPDQPDPGVEIPVEAEAGAAASQPAASARAVSGPVSDQVFGPVLSVPALPGAGLTRAPTAAPAAPVDLRAYADSIRRRIDAEKQYPARARRLGLQGVATVLVAVDSRGRLVRPPRLARTSGVAALDHEALRMVQAAAPFTPPAGAAPTTGPLEVQVPVRFSLADTH